MTNGEKIIARAELLHWLITRWTFHHENWIAAWQAQQALQAIGITVDHDEATELLLGMGDEGFLLNPQLDTPPTWRLPAVLAQRRLIAHKPVTGTRARAFLDQCGHLIAQNAP